MPSTSPDLNKIRIAFMERVNVPSIPPHAFKLAHLIAYRYMNRQTRTARPAQSTLAHDLNVSVRTVQRLLGILAPLGLRSGEGKLRFPLSAGRERSRFARRNFPSGGDPAAHAAPRRNL